MCELGEQCEALVPSSVEAHGISSAEAQEASSEEAHGASSVEGCGACGVVGPVDLRACVQLGLWIYGRVGL